MIDQNREHFIGSLAGHRRPCSSAVRATSRRCCSPPARPTCDRTSPVGIAARLQRTPDLSQRESDLAEEEDHTDVPDCPPDITPSTRRPSRRAAPILHLRRERLDPRTDRSISSGVTPQQDHNRTDRRADPALSRMGQPGRPARRRRPPDGQRPSRSADSSSATRPRSSTTTTESCSTTPSSAAIRPRPLAPAVARVIARTGCRPRTITADRGYGEARVESDLHRLGVPTWPPCRCGRCI